MSCHQKIMEDFKAAFLNFWQQRGDHTLEEAEEIAANLADLIEPDVRMVVGVRGPSGDFVVDSFDKNGQMLRTVIHQ